jgi:hypothetical protein
MPKFTAAVSLLILGSLILLFPAPVNALKEDAIITLTNKVRRDAGPHGISLKAVVLSIE